jgi:hypothetical protein
MRAAHLLTIGLLLVGAFAAAQEPGAPFVPKEDSNCWNCHGPGLWNPPMNPNFQVIPTLANPTLGEAFDYRVELTNDWRAEQLDMFITLDISRAPSLQFVGGREPTRNSTDGVIDVDPATGPLFVTSTKTGDAIVDVPSGATAIRIELIPDNTNAQTGPDLTMNVFDSRSGTAGAPSAVINNGGTGASEIYSLKTAGDVASHGFGDWTIQAETTLAGAGTPPGVDPQAADVKFIVVVDAWFNTTGQTQQILSKPGPVVPASKDIFTFKLIMNKAPAAGETLAVYANATTFYEHEPGVDENDWNFVENNTAPVLSLADGSIEMGLETQVLTVNAAGNVPVSMAAISEAVGYAAAFLLVTSVFTGGMFGRATRRWQNKVFGSARRRVAFHNFLSYGIITAALVHMTIFVIDKIEPNYPWQLGLIWGGLGNLALLGLGVTGAIQVPMIRKWNYATWRWTHFYLSIGAILFTIVHMLLDGQNFGAVQDALNYVDPLVPSNRS